MKEDERKGKRDLLTKYGWVGKNEGDSVINSNDLEIIQRGRRQRQRRQTVLISHTKSQGFKGQD
jgi:hypothetical protein